MAEVVPAQVEAGVVASVVGCLLQAGPSNMEQATPSVEAFKDPPITAYQAGTTTRTLGFHSREDLLELGAAVVSMGAGRVMQVNHPSGV